MLIGRRPDGAVVGTLLGLLSLSVAHVVLKEVWLQWLPSTGDEEEWAWLVAVTAENAWWILGTFGLLLLYFPDGRLPSRRWRWVPPLMVLSVASVQVYGAFADEPFRPPLQDLDRPFGEPPLVIDVLGGLFFVMLPLFVACARLAGRCGSAAPTPSSASRSSGWPSPASGCPSTRSCA